MPSAERKTSQQAGRVDEPDESGDYELEPPDEHVTRAAEERAREELRRAESAVDVNAVYEEMRRGKEVDWSEVADGLSFRFRIRHVLIATAAVAVLLGVWVSGLTGDMVAIGIVLSLVGLGAAHAYLEWREAARVEAALRRRDWREAKDRGEELGDEPPDPESLDLESAVEALRRYFTRWPRFTLLELFTASVMAGIVVICVLLTGQVQTTASLMGAVAVLGFALQAVGVETPRVCAAAWWLAVLAWLVLTLGLMAGRALGL